jgi:hypothetical protein
MSSIPLAVRQGSDGLSVSAAGTVLFRMSEPDVQAPDTEASRPYLHPVRTLGGTLVSAHRPHDHPWHAGLSIALPHVGRHNFWGGPTYERDRGYVQLPNNGRQSYRDPATVIASDGTILVDATLDWTAAASSVAAAAPRRGERTPGTLVLSERRRLTAAATTDGWTVVVESVLVNASGGPLPQGSPATAGRAGAGYGGLFWRLPPSFLGATVLTPEGRRRDDANGIRAEWLGLASGAAAPATVLMVSDSANVRSPSGWFVRTEEYAGFCPSPFDREELLVPVGGSVRLRYACVISDGAPDPETLAAAGRSALDAAPRLPESPDRPDLSGDHIHDTAGVAPDIRDSTTPTETSER